MGLPEVLKKQFTASKLSFHVFFWGLHIALLAYGWWV